MAFVKLIEVLFFLSTTQLNVGKVVKIGILHRIVGGRWDRRSQDPTLFEKKKKKHICMLNDHINYTVIHKFASI